jgi:hypothetical protein
MRKPHKKLSLNRDTLVTLSSNQLGGVYGGAATRFCPTDGTNGTYDCTGSNLNCTTSCGCDITLYY